MGGVLVVIIYHGPDGTAGGGDDIVIEVTTDPDGSYEVPGLPEGEYTVSIVPPPGEFDPSVNPDGFVPPSTEVSITPGETELDIDFGLVASASVVCHVYADTNGNRSQDPGEPGVAGVVVQLVDADGNVVREITTESDGVVNFPGVLPGDYTLRYQVPTQYGAVDEAPVVADADGHSCNSVGLLTQAQLSRTGAETTALLWLALALLLAGLAALAVGYRLVAQPESR